MAVTQAMISYVSPYTVDAAGDFTPTLFSYYEPVAKLKLDAEDTGLSTAMYDHCHALLICHMYAVARKVDTSVSSERVGDASVSFFSAESGSKFLLEYEKILSTFVSSGLEEVERVDSDMPELQLDQGIITDYEPD